MNWKEVIPQEEQVCINCEHLHNTMNNNPVGACIGCCNLDSKWEENHFYPEEIEKDDYKDCQNCKNASTMQCETCKRNPWLTDNWEEADEQV